MVIWKEAMVARGRAERSAAMILQLHKTSKRGITSLNLCSRKITRTLRHRNTTWLCFAILMCIPRVLLASILNRSGEEHNDDNNANVPIDNCKSERDGLTAKHIRGSAFEKYSPPEWSSLTAEKKAKLAYLLSFENLSTWEFNVVEVADLTSAPLLLVGWAILCEPMAQEAMEHSLEVNSASVHVKGEGTVSQPDSAYHYHFSEHIRINPQAVCNFLREIEQRYIRENPYHNNIHAADITQNLHSLFQMFGEEYLFQIYDRISIFSLLLAATFHDVGKCIYARKTSFQCDLFNYEVLLYRSPRNKQFFSANVADSNINSI
jgi:hypothetical protein